MLSVPVSVSGKSTDADLIYAFAMDDPLRKSKYIKLLESMRILERTPGRRYGWTRIIPNKLSFKSNAKLSQWVVDREEFEGFVCCKRGGR